MTSINKNLTNKSFSFTNRSNKEMADEVNEEYPIQLVRNQDLVERVFQRYQVLGKAEVAIIVKAVFTCMRELLILGKVLNLNKLFADVKLKFWMSHGGGQPIPIPYCKVSTSTPKKMRKKNAEPV